MVLMFLSHYKFINHFQFIINLLSKLIAHNIMTIQHTTLYFSTYNLIHLIRMFSLFQTDWAVGLYYFIVVISTYHIIKCYDKHIIYYIDMYCLFLLNINKIVLIIKEYINAVSHISLNKRSKWINKKCFDLGMIVRK